MTALLSLITDKDVAVWKGLILVLFLFIAGLLWSPMFHISLALGQVSGLYQKTLIYFTKTNKYLSCRRETALQGLSVLAEIQVAVLCYFGHC